jgi:hypothetical protein
MGFVDALLDEENVSVLLLREESQYFGAVLFLDPVCVLFRA